MRDKNTMKNKIIAGINRFIAEMPPYWEREELKKLVLPYDLDNDFIQEILKELESDNIIHLLAGNKHYIVITEDYIKQIYSNDIDIANFRTKQIKEIMANTQKKK
ncbi:MAG: hypothetical protein HQK53_11560 [Oligoflexia bacterium]|nr:hypothetical protein [Oligoflexia bacterium]